MGEGRTGGPVRLAVDWIASRRYAAVTMVLLALAMAQLGYLLRTAAPDDRRALLELEAAMLGLATLTGAAALLPELPALVNRALNRLGRALGPIAWILWLGCLLTLPVLLLGDGGIRFQPLWVRAVLLWLLALVGASLLNSAWSHHAFDRRLLLTALAAGSLYHAGTQLLGISNYPLTLGWSEASRYYYASLYLSETIYGVRAPLSVLHPSRYLLQALPFLMPDSQIWMHRLWQSLLWLGLPLLTVLGLARRLRIERPLDRLLYALWAFLFLYQGPILYHLLPTAIPLLWCMQPRRFGRSLLLVAACSAWAGISRINWFAVPGFLAATVYLLEQPRGSAPRTRYWVRPLVWIVLGGLTAVLTNAVYVLLSGNDPAEFGSSFSSDLFWYRLLPNPTFAPGILVAVVAVSLPAALALGIVPPRRPAGLDPARRLPLAGMLGVLLVGGVVVSVKIGGGSNLHNVDGYLLLLLVLVSYAVLGRVPEPEQHRAARRRWGTYLLLAAVPLLFNLNYQRPASPAAQRVADQVLGELRGRIAALGPDPQVLLISERQLLTFGLLNSIELLPRYEKVFLMEMAMSGTRPYLDTFHAGLRDQRFDLIVSDPLIVQFQGKARAFGEENDAWVREVVVPVLCYYQPVWTEEQVRVEVLMPRESAPACPEGG